MEKAIEKETLLEAILEVTNWLEDQEINSELGIRWHTVPIKDLKNPLTFEFEEKSFYGGSSGIAFFFLRLYIVTKEEKWLNKAIKAADYIINTYQKDDFDLDFGSLKGSSAGYYMGRSGNGYFVENLYQILKKDSFDYSEKYHEFALRVADDLVDAQKSDGSWSGGIGIISDGSIILFLLYLYDVTHDERYLESARKGGYYFISQAQALEEGYRWYTADSISFGFGPDGYFPNFEFGTAGNGYLMAVLYLFTKEDQFLAYAKGSASYVESIGVNVGDGVLIPYNVPYTKKLFYLGSCHGPVGTSRVYKLLYSITKDEHYKEYTELLTKGILSTGAPFIRSPGFWNNDCYCCSSASMLEYFIGIGKFLGTDEYDHYSDDIGKVILGRSTLVNDQRTWYQAFTRVLPKQIDTFTGYYTGASGIASSLLRLYNEKNNHEDLPVVLEEYWVK